jgi:hypothetical protein
MNRLSVALAREEGSTEDAFEPERVLPRAADLSVQALLEQRRQLRQLFFLRGLRSTEKRLFEPR